MELIRKEMSVVDKELVEKFMLKVDQKGSTQCWVWKSSVKDGRPTFMYVSRNGKKVTASARAFIYRMTQDMPQTEKHVFLPKCGNPLCVKPSHTLMASSEEQMKKAREALSKKRAKNAAIIEKQVASAGALANVAEVVTVPTSPTNPTGPTGPTGNVVAAVTPTAKAIKNPAVFGFLVEALDKEIERKKGQLRGWKLQVTQLETELGLFEAERKKYLAG